MSSCCSGSEGIGKDEYTDVKIDYVVTRQNVRRSLALL